MKRSLNYVIRVSEYGNINRAAEELFITPSALSKFILTRERELGVDLFDRSGKKFALTYAGEKYVEWAKKIVYMLDCMENEMTNIAQEKAGVMHFGVQIMQSKILLSRIIPGFEKSHPDINLMVDHSYTLNGLLSNLEMGFTDFVITSHHQKKDELAYQKIGEIEMALIVPKGHSGVKKAKEREGFRYPWVDIRNFEKENFISLNKEQEPRRITETVFEMADITPHINLQVPTSELAVCSVVNGLGLTITYDFSAKFNEYAEQVELLSFGETAMKRDISIIYKQDFVPKSYEKAFFSHCKDFFS